MSRIAYVGGQYVPHRQAAVHIEDRGYQFADGVYEVMAISGGRLVDEEGHLDRLDRSLAALRIAPPMGRRALRLVARELMRRNRLRDGMIYIQVTRGVAPRDHAFPANTAPALVLTARPTAAGRSATRRAGVKVITVPDIRWKRCNIKSIALLPNVLAKQAAVDAGAYEAWQVDADDQVTEGCASNAWIITGDGDDDGEIVTHVTDNSILSGITRRAVTRLAAETGLALVERAFTVAEAKAAREAFLTSTTSHVTPVVRIDDTPVADGRPGPLTRRLQALYDVHAAAVA